MKLDIFVPKNVMAFNPKLQGKAVQIEGYDVDGEAWNRLFLVKDCLDDHLYLINDQGKDIKVHKENFERDGFLTITVLEEK